MISADTGSELVINGRIAGLNVDTPAVFPMA